MYEYRIVLKSGHGLFFKSEYIDILTIHSMLNDNDPFIKLGNYVIAKDIVEAVEKLEITKKEN